MGQPDSTFAGRLKRALRAAFTQESSAPRVEMKGVGEQEPGTRVRGQAVVEAPVQAPVQAVPPVPGSFDRVRESAYWWPRYRIWANGAGHEGENVGFLEAVDSYRAPNSQTWPRLEGIIGQYVGDDSTTPVNISGPDVGRINGVRAADPRPAAPPIDAFDRAYDGITALLRNNYGNFVNTIPDGVPREAVPE